MDLFKPRGAATPRRPTDNNQNNGLMVNTPRFSQFGGLNSPSKVGKTGMAVQKPADGKKVI